jgi:hypothetical protein
MNNLISSNPVVRKYGLRRVSHYWGFKEDSYIYYMLAPPWVRLLINDVVNFIKIPQSNAQQDEDSDEPSFSSDEESRDPRKDVNKRLKRV